MKSSWFYNKIENFWVFKFSFSKQGIAQYRKYKLLFQTLRFNIIFESISTKAELMPRQILFFFGITNWFEITKKWKMHLYLSPVRGPCHILHRPAACDCLFGRRSSRSPVLACYLKEQFKYRSSNHLSGTKLQIKQFYTM